METFGQKMRQAVANRGLRLDQLVKETRLPVEHLQALGCDDFGALPDDDMVENGLRSFAQLVGVEPEQVIEDYRRERRQWLDSVPTVEVAPPDPLEETPPLRPGRLPAFATWAVAILALAILTFFWLRSPAAGSARTAAPAQDEMPVTEAAIPRVRPAAPVSPEPAIEPSIGTDGMSIPEHGVGREVVDRELVGEAERFAEGERVWFWTRIEGGEAGRSITHVWVHEGEESMRVPLRLGGARWRTQSYKTLAAGSAGRWVVEAQDETGQVLARREFICAPTP